MGSQKMNDMLYQLKNSRIEMYPSWISSLAKINIGESRECHEILEQMDFFASIVLESLIRHEGVDLSLIAMY